ncbi:ycf45 [Symbiodinium sp. CCMP2456]|nr:ycf45 [Symbiodinium sp. CCMP2456]
MDDSFLPKRLIGFQDLPNVPDSEEPSLPGSNAPSLLPPTGTHSGVLTGCLKPPSAEPRPPSSLGPQTLGPAPTSDVGPSVSGDFRNVLEKVVQQHLQDMADLENRVRMAMEVEHHRSLSSESNDDDNEGLKSPEGLSTPSAAVRPRRMSTGMMVDDLPTRESSKKSKLGRSATTALFAQMKKPRQQLQASEVLDAWEHQEAKVEELFKVDPLQEPEVIHDNFMIVKETETADRLIDPTRLQRFQVFLQSSKFDMVIATVVFVNVLWMALKLQVDGSISGWQIGIFKRPLLDPQQGGEWWLTFTQVGDVIFTGLFFMDVGIRIAVLGLAFWKVWLNYVDVLVTIVSLMEVMTYYAVPFPINPALFRLLRIGKLARALRMLPVTNALASLQLLVKGLSASRGMLFWSFCLLTFLQCVAGMVVSTLVRDFITDDTHPDFNREEVFRYYGTFTRTFLSMFEILFANWGPPCRVLVEYVGEYYSIFFLLYRCVLGFAVINVVNAIFVQQTLKTASSDDELAFKNKEKDIALYANKVKKLFQTMDFSGDGAINLEEFSKLVKSPKLKFWMSQLELEYHDLLSLFEFLDNGDGEITLTEFIEGAARLRGGAKALDIWRMETKLEVLFEEVLTILNFIKGGAMVPNDPSISVVQDVFNNSLFKHIQSTARGRQRSAE